MNISIHNYRESDYNEISALWELLGMGGAERGDDANVIQRTLENGGALFIAKNEFSVVGTVWITTDQRRLYLHHMGVHPDFQNKGIGTLMLDKCIEWGKQIGLQMKLEVNPANTIAVAVYEKARFKRLCDYDVFIIRDYDLL
ncbi:MAG: GNAT family N-acetyltransferase [Salinivirgaceae bacterium]|nr:GNAT family N-acetyltransferase [Salinivirgaceae bacterium]